MDGPSHGGQIIVVTIDMGQPGSFAAKFIAWAKKMQAKSEAKSCGQILTYVGQILWPNPYICGPEHVGQILMVREARSHPRVIHDIQGQQGDARHLSATTLPWAGFRASQR